MQTHTRTHAHTHTHTYTHTHLGRAQIWAQAYLDGVPRAGASTKLAQRWAGQPALLAAVMGRVVCRYTEEGDVGGERNLELPPVVERERARWVGAWLALGEGGVGVWGQP
jgi:hypothetical protein